MTQAVGNERPLWPIVRQAEAWKAAHSSGALPRDFPGGWPFGAHF